MASFTVSSGSNTDRCYGEIPGNGTDKGHGRISAIIDSQSIEAFDDDNDNKVIASSSPKMRTGEEDEEGNGIGRLKRRKRSSIPSSRSIGQGETPRRHGTSISGNTDFNRSEFSLLPSRSARFRIRVEQLKSSASCSSPTTVVCSEKDSKANHKGIPSMPSPPPSPSQSTKVASNARSKEMNIPELLPRVGRLDETIDARLEEQASDAWDTFSLIPSRNTDFARRLLRLKASQSGSRACGKQHVDVDTCLAVGVKETTTKRDAKDSSPDRTRPACTEDESPAFDLEPQVLAPGNSASLEACLQRDGEDGQRVQLPAILLIEYIASYVGDRATWNAIATLNKDIYSLSKNLTHLYRPWPPVRWRVASGRAWSVAFGEDYLCCGTDQGTLLVWKVHGCGSAKSLNHNMARGGGGRQQPEPDSGRINCVKCHGDWIVSAGDNRLARLWNVRSWSCEAALEGHTGSITSVAILRKDDGGTVLTTGHPSVSSCMWIATASLDFDIRLYSVAYDHVRVVSTECLRTLVGAHNGPVYSVVMYEKDGEPCLVSGGQDERLRLWDISHNGNAKDDTQVRQHEGPGRSRSILSSEGEIRSISVSQGQQRIAASFGRSVFHCDLLSGLFCPDLRQDTDDDHRLVVTDNGCDRKGWRVLKGHSSDIRCIDFSPDGKLIASACSDGTIRLWTLGAGTWTRKWKAHNGFMVSNLAFSPDGQSLLSVGSDGTIAIEKL